MRSRLVLRGLVAGVLVAFGLGCGEEDPTLLGQDLRTAPDTLRVLEVTTVAHDSVYALPLSLRNSPTGQIGMQGPYTSQILYDFRIPSFIVEDAETLQLDEAVFEIALTQRSEAPYAGGMRLTLREVEPDSRRWSETEVYEDTVLTQLPALRPGTVAPEDTLQGEALTGDSPTLQLDVDVHSLVGFDSVLAVRGTLEANMALVFLGFDAGGPGFLEFTQITASGVPTPRLIGTYVDPLGVTTGSEAAVTATRQLVVVEFDTTYGAGTNWVASDAHRLHTFFRFVDLITALPESAIVFLGDLILTQAARGDTVFGVGPQLGVIVPSDSVLADSTRVYSQAENNRALAFQTSIAPLADAQVVIPVTEYLFDQQDRSVVNRGMILRLSNEGTKARHFEFYGPQALDPAKRPRLRVLYTLPADFGEGRP